MVVDVNHQPGLAALPRLHERALAALASGVVIVEARYPDFPIVDVNAGFVSLTGMQPEQARGHPIADALGPDTAPAAIASINDAMRRGEAHTETLAVQRADGTSLWCEIQLIPDQDDAGNLAHVICLIRSVDAERRSALLAHEATDQVHILFASHPQPMWIFDPTNLRILDVNEAATSFYGYSRNEFLRMTLLDVRPQEDRAAIVAKAQFVRDHPGGIDSAGVWRHQRKNGTIVDVDVTTHAITLDGVPVRLSVMVDVTEQERAEAAWRASEDRLQAILDNTGAIVIIKDLSGSYLMVNRQFASRFQICREDAVGKRDEDVFPAELAATIRANDRVVIDTGTPLEIEETMGREDELHTYLAMKFPLRDSRGNIYASCTFATDITERKRVEELQRIMVEASTLLTASFDNAAALANVAELVVPALADLCVIDVVEDTFLRPVKFAHRDPAVRAEMEATRAKYPIAVDDAIGVAQVIRTGQPILHAAIDEPVLQRAASDDEHLERLRNFGLRSSIITPMVARGRVVGALTLASIESGRIFGPNDVALASDLAHRCALAIDNTRLYSEAQAAVRARDQFLSIAAHELRTPVSGIKGYSQMLLRSFNRNTLGPERLSHALNTINHASERLVVLTNDLLDVSRIRLGQLPLRMRSLDLAAMVRQLPDQLTEQYPNWPPLRLEVPATQCLVDADSDRLEQVLANVLDNAVKYSPEERPISASLNPADGGYLIKVRDEGIGLPAEALETIFEPFGRAANATARNLPGLGLGLHISRSIIERHGGRIWAESAGEGLGTTIAVWLPVGSPGD